jgi:DNA-binding CsgD family transcriptional regulator
MLDLTDFDLSRPADQALARAARPAHDASAAAAPPRGHTGFDRRSAGGQQQRRMAQMLDTLDHGMLLVSDTIRVCHVNGAAWRDLDDQHPLQLMGAGPDDLQLQARFGPDVVPLREALVGAAQRGLRRLLPLGMGSQRVSVAVVPLPALAAADAPCAAVLLGRRQVCEELTVDWFARSHRLSTAETAVMKGLCADFTPQQIAERQGVGLATIRTQIGSIRLKTGACSIRALVRQVALLPPLVSALLGAPRASDRVPHA